MLSTRDSLIRSISFLSYKEILETIQDPSVYSFLRQIYTQVLGLAENITDNELSPLKQTIDQLYDQYKSSDGVIYAYYYLLRTHFKIGIEIPDLYVPSALLSFYEKQGDKITDRLPVPNDAGGYKANATEHYFVDVVNVENKPITMLAALAQTERDLSDNPVLSLYGTFMRVHNFDGTAVRREMDVQTIFGPSPDADAFAHKSSVADKTVYLIVITDILNKSTNEIELFLVPSGITNKESVWENVIDLMFVIDSLIVKVRSPCISNASIDPEKLRNIFRQQFMPEFYTTLLSILGMRHVEQPSAAIKYYGMAEECLLARDNYLASDYHKESFIYVAVALAGCMLVSKNIKRAQSYLEFAGELIEKIRRPADRKRMRERFHGTCRKFNCTYLIKKFKNNSNALHASEYIKQQGESVPTLAEHISKYDDIDPPLLTVALALGAKLKLSISEIGNTNAYKQNLVRDIIDGIKHKDTVLIFRGITYAMLELQSCFLYLSNVDAIFLLIRMTADIPEAEMYLNARMLNLATQDQFPASLHAYLDEIFHRLLNKIYNGEISRADFEILKDELCAESASLDDKRTIIAITASMVSIKKVTAYYSLLLKIFKRPKNENAPNKPLLLRDKINALLSMADDDVLAVINRDIPAIEKRIPKLSTEASLVKYAIPHAVLANDFTIVKMLAECPNVSFTIPKNLLEEFCSALNDIEVAKLIYRRKAETSNVIAWFARNRDTTRTSPALNKVSMFFAKLHDLDEITYEYLQGEWRLDEHFKFSCTGLRVLDIQPTQMLSIVRDTLNKFLVYLNPRPSSEGFEVSDHDFMLFINREWLDDATKAAIKKEIKSVVDNVQSVNRIKKSDAVKIAYKATDIGGDQEITRQDKSKTKVKTKGGKKKAAQQTTMANVSNTTEHVNKSLNSATSSAPAAMPTPAPQLRAAETKKRFIDVKNKILQATLPAAMQALATLSALAQAYNDYPKDAYTQQRYLYAVFYHLYMYFHCLDLNDQNISTCINTTTAWKLKSRLIQHFKNESVDLSAQNSELRAFIVNLHALDKDQLEQLSQGANVEIKLVPTSDTTYGLFMFPGILRQSIKTNVNHPAATYISHIFKRIEFMAKLCGYHGFSKQRSLLNLSQKNVSALKWLVIEIGGCIKYLNEIGAYKQFRTMIMKEYGIFPDILAYFPHPQLNAEVATQDIFTRAANQLANGSGEHKTLEQLYSLVVRMYKASKYGKSQAAQNKMRLLFDIYEEIEGGDDAELFSEQLTDPLSDTSMQPARIPLRDYDSNNPNDNFNDRYPGTMFTDGNNMVVTANTVGNIDYSKLHLTDNPKNPTQFGLFPPSPSTSKAPLNPYAAEFIPRNINIRRNPT